MMTSPAGFSPSGLPLFTLFTSTPKRAISNPEHSSIDPIDCLLAFNEDERKLFYQEEYVLFDDCEIT